MPRKVFLSMLGTGFYEETTYAAEPARPLPPTRFIQEATLLYHNAAQWTAADQIIIALTHRAKTSNWSIEGNKRQKQCKGAEFDYVGLEDCLRALNLQAQVTPLPIPDGKNEDEMWQIFTAIYEELQEGDELYIDLTHSFRYLPMLLLVLVDYARFIKKVSVKSLTYGNYEARDTATNIAPIADLMPLVALQNWTSAASEFVKNGNAQSVCEAASKELKPLLRNDETRTADIKELNNATNKLAQWVEQIRTCRGCDIMSGQILGDFRTRLSKTLRNRFAPLTPILDEINRSFSEKAFTAGKKDELYIGNCYAAAKWCVEMGLWQPAITILQEAIITRVCMVAGLSGKDIKDTKCRDLFSLAVRVSNNDTRLEECNLKFGYEEKFRAILSLSWWSEENFKDLCHQIQEIRNDFNHSGMRESRSDEGKMAQNIRKYVNAAAFIFNTTPTSSEENYNDLLAGIEGKPPLFINLSNHPSTDWSDEQLAAAAEYGELRDMTFPAIAPAATGQDIDSLVKKYAKKLSKEAQTHAITLHLMGEMTFTHRLVNKLRGSGITCLASTTSRIAVANPDGTKTSTFRFVRFRRY